MNTKKPRAMRIDKARRILGIDPDQKPTGTSPNRPGASFIKEALRMIIGTVEKSGFSVANRSSYEVFGLFSKEDVQAILVVITGWALRRSDSVYNAVIEATGDEPTPESKERIYRYVERVKEIGYWGDNFVTCHPWIVNNGDNVYTIDEFLMALHAQVIQGKLGFDMASNMFLTNRTGQEHGEVMSDLLDNLRRARGGEG